MNLHLMSALTGVVPAFGDMDGRGWRGFQILGSIASVFGGLVMFAIIAAIVYFLLRFLIIGTKAAQLFIDQNSPTGPPSPRASDAPASVPPTEPTVPTAPADEKHVPADPPADDSAATLVLPPVDQPAAGVTSATADAPTTPLAPAKPPRAPRAPRTPKPRE